MMHWLLIESNLIRSMQLQKNNPSTVVIHNLFPTRNFLSPTFQPPQPYLKAGIILVTSQQRPGKNQGFPCLDVTFSCIWESLY